MKQVIIVMLLLLNCISLSYSQSDQEQHSRLETFKMKLDDYFENRKDIDSAMVKKTPEAGQDNMPTGDIKSYMIDRRTGLAFEFSTKKIYDKETEMVYYMNEKKIHDTIEDKFYRYSVP